MTEIICEEISHQAGFAVSVGNWIAPNGELILGTTYETHHWETLIEHLGQTPTTDNNLALMNKIIAEEGYIRLVFRVDALFQVGAKSTDELWGEQPNYQRLMSIIGRLKETDIHIFSAHFYVIGNAEDIVAKRLNKLQIRIQK